MGSTRAAPPTGAAVATATLVTQTSVRPESSADFDRWQGRVNDAVARFPGFLAHEVIPPSPPVQPDWVIVQRFASIDAARAWLDSAERRRLLDEARPWLVGRDDVHVFQGDDASQTPTPVSAVISTRVRPEQEAAYRAWQRRIAAAEQALPGFRGSKIEPPIPGVQDDWVTIVRFDSESHLDAWISSPVRARLLEEAAAFTTDTRVRTVRTGFDSWFRVGEGAAATPPPPAWKQNMIVVLALYPVVFLFGHWVQDPLLIERGGMPFWLALFVGNVASVLLLSRLVPWLSGRFGWWLTPGAGTTGRLAWAGAALVVLLYGLWLFAFSRFP